MVCEPRRMTNPRPKRRFQFGLRKLLLWTAVVALYFATVRWVAMDVRGFTVVTCWVGIVAILRAVAGRIMAGLLSVAGGLFLAASVSILVANAIPVTRSQVLFAFWKAGAVGCIVFVIVELAFSSMHRPSQDRRRNRS